MITYIIYFMCTFFLAISFIRDKERTKKAFIRGVKSWESIMPQFFLIIVIVGITLSILNPHSISNLIGSNSGLLGTTVSSTLGAITMMPTFIAFSIGDSLLQNGAGYSQVAAFISTSTMVGVLTFSLESSYIGKKAALYRNILAFLFAYIVAFAIGGILG